MITGLNIVNYTVKMYYLRPLKSTKMRCVRPPSGPIGAHSVPRCPSWIKGEQKGEETKKGVWGRSRWAQKFVPPLQSRACTIVDNVIQRTTSSWETKQEIWT